MKTKKTQSKRVAAKKAVTQEPLVHRLVVIHQLGATFAVGNSQKHKQIMLSRREENSPDFFIDTVLGADQQVTDAAYDCLQWIQGHKEGFWKGRVLNYVVDIHAEKNNTSTEKL